MSAMAFSSIVLACVFGGAVFGTLFRRALPDHHLSADSQDVVKLAMGLVATMSALVLGLLISSAKSFYDAQTADLTQISSRIIFLDRVLAHYGPETADARDKLRGVVVDNLARIWPEESHRPSQIGAPAIGSDTLVDKIQALSPKDDRQRSLQAQALGMAIDLGETRWLMYEQEAVSVSKPMLMVLVFWLTAIFISFGLFAPRNATVTTALFVAALSVSGAIFLILEMYTPFSGVIRLSSAPLRSALVHLGQ
jgi:Protein of unknown function (DUF4239)